MKKRILVRFFAAAVLVNGLFPFRPNALEPLPTSSLVSALPQESPRQKLKYDYMSTFLSRSTRPLGLKEDLLMKKILKQPRASWATRAGIRHILD